jgi:hypothetical protein
MATKTPLVKSGEIVPDRRQLACIFAASSRKRFSLLRSSSLRPDGSFEPDEINVGQRIEHQNDTRREAVIA